jgi:Bacterial Ig-like domain
VRRIVVVLGVAALMAATVVLAAGTALAQGGPQEALDANNPSTERLGEFATGTIGDQEYVVAQQFTAESTGTLTSARVRLSTNRDLGSLTGSFTMEITEVEPSGTPAGDTPTRVLASTTIPASEITDHLVTGHFTDPAQVVAGQKYALLLRSDSPSFDYQFVYSFDSYSGGWVVTGQPTPNWLGYGVADLIFATYVTPPAPTITNTSPEAGATGVKRSTNITASFSEAMAPASITKSTFKLYKCSSTSSTDCNKQVTKGKVTLSDDGLTATLDPYGTSDTKLARKTKYKATITTEAKDMEGTPLDQQKEWYFTTRGK